MSLRRVLQAVGLAGLALMAGAGSAARGVPAGSPYAAERDATDTLRVRVSRTHPTEPGRASLGGVVTGYLSPRGLPPMAGAVFITDTGLVFRSADGRYGATLPVVGPVRRSAHGRWRASAVTLAYVDDALGRRSYLFRVDGGVFMTDAPGSLLDLSEHPEWLDSLDSREWVTERALVNAGDRAAVTRLLDAIVNGSYADSLYAIFGRPARAAGVVGPEGRAAGRLGEYVATRDSLALDPGHITSMRQLRHTLAHELAHRWQSRAGAQLDVLWRDVPAIRDPKRYGYGSRIEHQAEAAAFAIHFLLATAAGRDANAEAQVLDQYELLVPGTRTMARYFALQPLFAHHPLRAVLTTGRKA